MGGHGNAAIYRPHLDLYSDDVIFGGVSPEPMDKAGVVAFHEGTTTSSRSASKEARMNNVMRNYN
jgi:hypothetical protein